MTKEILIPVAEVPCPVHVRFCSPRIADPVASKLMRREVNDLHNCTPVSSLPKSLALVEIALSYSDRHYCPRTQDSTTKNPLKVDCG